jgi:beta-lactamase regulating signal transducer with metallopeptidase domain
MFAVNVALGTLATASVLFVVTRLIETWRIGTGRPPDAVSVLGQRLSYPAANAGAIVIVALAGCGLIVLITAIRAAARELRTDARFNGAMAREIRASIDGARVIDDDRPQAFCAGLLHPRVYVSRGALAMLGEAELSAVLAHERHHARRHDPLRLASTRVLADALFFLPPLRHLIEQQQSLVEIGADEAALTAGGGDRAALAAAMLTFSEGSDAEAAGLAPERVDHLVGESPGWRFPLALVFVICFCLAAIVTLAVLAAETARGSATLAPPLVSAQPCIVMLALIPAGAALAGVLFVRKRTRSTRVLVRPSTTQS